MSDELIQHITINKPLFNCRYTAAYSPAHNAIQLILNSDINGVIYNNCTDKELMLLITSEINHELIHYVIQKYINSDTSMRYDLIARKTRTHDFKGITKIMKKLGYSFVSRKELKYRYGII